MPVVAFQSRTFAQFKSPMNKFPAASSAKFCGLWILATAAAPSVHDPELAKPIKVPTVLLGQTTLILLLLLSAMKTVLSALTATPYPLIVDTLPKGPSFSINGTTEPLKFPREDTMQGSGEAEAVGVPEGVPGMVGVPLSVPLTEGDALDVALNETVALVVGVCETVGVGVGDDSGQGGPHAMPCTTRMRPNCES